MNRSDLQKLHRRSIRLAGYDYTENGAYSITLCALNRREVFGTIQEGALHLNVYGTIVLDCWLETPIHRPHVSLDEFIVMPNHFHAIVLLTRARGLAHDNFCGGQHRTGPARQSVGALIGAFKSAATRQINLYRRSRGLDPVQVWQRNYFERIIRNERELDDTRRYIAENPLHWLRDENNPDIARN